MDYVGRDKSNPITSFGIILYTRTHNNQYLYLIGKRRDSISYSEFLKNNLTEDNIVMHINLMSDEERKRCIDHYKNNTFEILWDDLWINHNHRMYRYEYNRCNVSFYKNMEKYLEIFTDPLITSRRDNPWSFFKGRKHYTETSLRCALREFEEETTINQDQLSVLNIDPLVETYVGTDNRLYQTIYFVAYISYQPFIYIKYTSNRLRKTRVSDEISTVLWVTYTQACEMLQDNSVGCDNRVDIIRKVNNILLFEPAIKRSKIRRARSR